MTQHIHRSHFQRHAAPASYVRISAMASQQPPEEGSDTSFWASVFTAEPPNVLCGVLTDLNLHRFTLHQHLTNNEALTETQLLHQPFQQALYHQLSKGISTTTTPTTWPTFTFGGPSTPSTLWDAIRPASISATRTRKLTTIQYQPPLNHHSQPQVACSQGNLCTFHQPFVIISAHSPPGPWSCSTTPHRPHLHISPPTAPNKPTS